MQNRSTPYLILAGATLFYFCANLQKVLVPGATFNELQMLFQLDAASVTRFGAAFFYTYALLQLFVGPLADRFSGAKVIAVAGGCLVIGSLCSALTVSPAVLLLSRILTGAGAAMVYLSLIQHAGSFLGEKLPIYLGGIFIIGYSGSIAGTTPFIAGVHHFGYAKMMFASGIFGLVIYLLYLAIYASGRKSAVKPGSPFAFKAWLSSFSLRNVSLFFLSSIPFAVTYTLLTIIGKKFLEDYVGLSPLVAGNVLFMMTIVAAVNGFLAAWVSKLISNRRLPILWYSVAGTLFLLLIFILAISVNCHSAWLFCLLCAAITSTANIAPVYVAYIREHNDAGKFATIVGNSNAIAYLFTALMGTLCGNLLDVFPPQLVDGIKIYGRNSYLLMFSALAAIASIALIFIVILTLLDLREKK